MKTKIGPPLKMYFALPNLKTWPRICTRTITRNQRLQTKTPEKERVNMASQAECELFPSWRLDFHFQVFWLTLLLGVYFWK